MGYQKVAGLIPVWGSETVFLRLGPDECSSIIQFCCVFIKRNYYLNVSSLG